MTEQERQDRQSQSLQDFYDRNSKLLEFKMPPADLGAYLAAYDEKKYRTVSDNLSYGRFVSPWIYDEAILKKYGSKILFHAAPQHNPMSPDSRFLVFVFQADSKKDIHLVMSVASADLSELPKFKNNDSEDPFKIFVTLEVYARSGKDFVKILKNNSKFQSEIPEIEAPDMGFAAHHAL